VEAANVVSCAGFRPPGRWPIPALLRPAAEKRQGTKSRGVAGGGAAGYGDFATGSGVPVMERGGSAVDLASWHEPDGEGERAAGVAAGVLHDEILRGLVVMKRQSDVAARASRLSAESQHRQRTSLGLSCHNAGIMRCRIEMR
jgi:hypothetical protein